MHRPPWPHGPWWVRHPDPLHVLWSPLLHHLSHHLLHGQGNKRMKNCSEVCSTSASVFVWSCSSIPGWWATERLPVNRNNSVKSPVYGNNSLYKHNMDTSMQHEECNQGTPSTSAWCCVFSIVSLGFRFKRYCVLFKVKVSQSCRFLKNKVLFVG